MKIDQNTGTAYEMQSTYFLKDFQSLKEGIYCLIIRYMVFDLYIAIGEDFIQSGNLKKVYRIKCVDFILDTSFLLNLWS